MEEPNANVQGENGSITRAEASAGLEASAMESAPQMVRERRHWWQSLKEPQAIVIAAFVAAVPAIFSSWVAYYLGRASNDSTKEMPVASSNNTLLDARKMFGEENGQPRVTIFNNERNNEQLQRSFEASQKSIQIVTSTGSSWLLGEHFPHFRNAIGRGLYIELLLFDFTDSALATIVQNAEIRNRLPYYGVDYSYNNLLNYRPLFKKSDRFQLGMYDAYPWIRFTLFDERAVSFVMTPFFNGYGTDLQKFYSEDDLIITLFKRLFFEFKSRSAVFRNQEDLDNWAKTKNLE